MDECCELLNDFRDEVGRNGKENNILELWLGPPGESRHNHRTRRSNISVVGWPPVASVRKNITNSCMRKQQATTEQENLSPKEENNKNYANPSEHMFVKVYMEGYPISQKISLRAYDGYEKLLFGINELFQVLLADDVSFAKHDARGPKEERALVYEDIEGDQILVGDVPWNNSKSLLCSTLLTQVPNKPYLRNHSIRYPPQRSCAF